jgi:inhibitor of KinA
MPPVPPYNITPLGDSALLLDFGNAIDENLNELVVSVYQQLRKHPLPGMVEAVPAYSSIAVYYQPGVIRIQGNSPGTAFESMSLAIRQLLEEGRGHSLKEGKFVTIPVCHDPDFAPDLKWIARRNKISENEIIRIHTSATYRVYMIGFLPGFPYMGILDEKIAAPRKAAPVMVEEGSVGIAGNQTGIYPFQSPGGWQIIGRTPLKLFDVSVKNSPALLQTGDLVQFTSITRDEFENIKSRHS